MTASSAAIVNGISMSFAKERTTVATIIATTGPAELWPSRRSSCSCSGLSGAVESFSTVGAQGLSAANASIVSDTDRLPP